MFRWLPSWRRNRQTTDPTARALIEAEQEELKSRIEAKVGRSIQPDIDRLVSRAQRVIRAQGHRT